MFSFAEIIDNKLFPVLDMKLRAGVHITKDDSTLELYNFINMTQEIDGEIYYPIDESLFKYYSKYDVEFVKLERNDTNIWFLEVNEKSKIEKTLIRKPLYLIILVLAFIDMEQITYPHKATPTTIYEKLSSMEFIGNDIEIYRMIKEHSKQPSSTEKLIEDILKEIGLKLKRLEELNFVYEIDKEVYGITSAVHRFVDEDILKYIEERKNNHE